MSLPMALPARAGPLSKARLVSVLREDLVDVKRDPIYKPRNENAAINAANFFVVPMFYACLVFDLLRESQNPSPPYLPAAFATGDDIPNELVVAVRYPGLPVSWPLKSGDKLVSLVMQTSSITPIINR